MLRFAFAQVVQMGAPLTILFQVVSDTLDRRMCPASPQSITRWARLIPAPATLERSFTSVVPLTGPLWIPMRTRSSGWLRSALLISFAQETGASGVVAKTSAIPSPVGRRVGLLSSIGCAERIGSP